MDCWDRRQARWSLLLFLVLVVCGLIGTHLLRPVYPRPSGGNRAWPPKGALLDATALRGRALEVFPGSTTIDEAVGRLGLEVDPVGSGFCLPRAGVLLRGAEGWGIRPMTQTERWIWRIPMNVYEADTEDLCRIDGIGPALADAIRRYVGTRKNLGSLDDLLEVRGVGPSRLERLKKELELQ